MPLPLPGCRATCVFHNLCLNATTLRFQYYVDARLPSEGRGMGAAGRTGKKPASQPAQPASQPRQAAWASPASGPPLPPDTPLLYTPEGTPLFEFPEDMVDAGARRPRSVHACLHA